MIVRDDSRLLIRRSGLNPSDESEQMLERLEKVRKHFSDMDIYIDEAARRPVGVVNLPVRNPEQTGDAVNWKTTVAVRLGQVRKEDRAEFCTKLADIAPGENWLGIVDELNQNLDGKCVAIDRSQAVRILFVTEKPIDWVDSDKLAQEIDHHAGAKLFVHTMLTQEHKSADYKWISNPHSEAKTDLTVEGPRGKWGSLNRDVPVRKFHKSEELDDCLMQLKHWLPNIEIREDEASGGLVGIVDDDIRVGMQLNTLRVTIRVQQPRNNAPEQAEFISRVATVRNEEYARSCTHHLNLFMDGKFVALDGQQPNTKDIAYVSTQPATWLDDMKLKHELGKHSTTRMCLEPLISPIAGDQPTPSMNEPERYAILRPLARVLEEQRLKTGEATGLKSIIQNDKNVPGHSSR